MKTMYDSIQRLIHEYLHNSCQKSCINLTSWNQYKIQVREYFFLIIRLVKVTNLVKKAPDAWHNCRRKKTMFPNEYNQTKSQFFSDWTINLLIMCCYVISSGL